MRLVQMHDLPAEARLAHDIFSGRDGTPLLRAGVTLSDRFVDHLRRAGIQAVWIDDQLGQGISALPVISGQSRGKATRALAALHNEALHAVVAGRSLDPEATEDLSDVVDEILQEIEERDDSTVVLSDLCGAEAYDVQHA